MKEIISKPIYFKATCDLCGTIFTYQKEDCEDYPYHDWVRCPNCNNDMPHGNFRAVYKESNK